MSKRKRFYEMTNEELTELDNSERYTKGRAAAFDHGLPETILEYWERQEPNDSELRAIVKNILGDM